MGRGPHSTASFVLGEGLDGTGRGPDYEGRSDGEGLDGTGRGLDYEGRPDGAGREPDDIGRGARRHREGGQTVRGGG